MCLIVIKPAGRPMPHSHQLKRWFKDFPDGFGLSFQNDQAVTILKGGMAQRQMFGIIKTAGKLSPKPLSDVAVVFHFRQSTGGSVKPANCHPFPVTTDRQALSAVQTNCQVALAHNGIIWDYQSYHDKQWYYNETETTDTQQFIEEYLAYFKDSLFNVAVQDMIASWTSSKYALMTPTRVYQLGTFYEDKGLWFSNLGYKPTAKPVIVHGGSTFHPSTEEFVEESRQAYNLSWADSPGQYGVRKYYDSTYALECDNCGFAEDTLYSLPEDPEFHVCHYCFQKIAGETPEQAIAKQAMTAPEQP